MKRNGMLAMALTLILAATVAWAGPGGHHDRDAHMDRLSEELGLDEYQSEQLSTILREQHQKFRAMGKGLRDQGVARDSDEARALREQAHEETRARLATVLTAEQIEQFEKMREHRKHRSHDKRKRNTNEEL